MENQLHTFGTGLAGMVIALLEIVNTFIVKGHEAIITVSELKIINHFINGEDSSCKASKIYNRDLKNTQSFCSNFANKNYHVRDRYTIEYLQKLLTRNLKLKAKQA